MNSALYECAVVHDRRTPREHRFEYRVFLFALDLDEIDEIARRVWPFSRNRRNLYSFRDSDHAGSGKPTVRENVVALLEENGIRGPFGRITLITNVRILGYVFNPVSFYFVETLSGTPAAAVAEVNNTFGETKLYILGADALRGRLFDSRCAKDFYISPFLRVDGELRLRLAVPDARVGAVIDSYEDGERVVRATLTGARRELTSARLLLYTVLYPLLTLKVIGAIHWEALRLFVKGIRFYRKRENADRQRGLHARAA